MWRNTEEMAHYIAEGFDRVGVMAHGAATASVLLAGKVFIVTGSDIDIEGTPWNNPSFYLHILALG